MIRGFIANVIFAALLIWIGDANDESIPFKVAKMSDHQSDLNCSKAGIGTIKRSAGPPLVVHSGGAPWKSVVGMRTEDSREYDLPSGDSRLIDLLETKKFSLTDRAINRSRRTPYIDGTVAADVTAPAAAAKAAQSSPSSVRGRSKAFFDYSNEYRIKQRIFQNYDKDTRPVRRDSTTTVLTVGMSLYHILDTNEKYQTLSSLIAVRLRWTDEYLQWDPNDFDGVDQIWTPAMKIWTPDLFISNFADDSFKDCMDTNAIISSSGHVLWMFPAVAKTYCTFEVRHFPFDRQFCSVSFISWTFNGFKLNLTFNASENQAIYYTPKNQEWNVDELTVERHERVYACCLEPYPDVTFVIHMTRRSLFYVINLIFPCLLIYAVSFLGFFLPIESGEKINLEITILLALVVFLLMVGETLPPTPDAIPALGLLFGLTMIMVSMALVMSVVVTNVFLRKDTNQRVPDILRLVFLRQNKSSKRSSTTHNNVKNPISTVTPGLPNHSGSDLARSKTNDLDSISILSDLDSMQGHISTFLPSDRIVARCSSFCIMSRPPNQPNDQPNMSKPHLPAAGESVEWMQVAKEIDRMFFWIFVTFSAASLGGLFFGIPHRSIS